MRVSPTTKGFVRVPKNIQRFTSAARMSDDLIITPMYDEYLLRHPEIVADVQVFQRVMREMTKKPRDRRRSFSASSAGYCMRRQELAFLGVGQSPITDPRTVRIFNNGTFVHLRWQVGLMSAKILRGIEVTTDLRDGLFRATLDGIGVAQRGRYAGTRFVWEHKGRNSYAFNAQELSGTPDAKTRKQVAMQMYLTGYDVAVVTNEDKGNQDVSEFVIERSDEEVLDAQRELEELASAIEKQKLHPMLPECVKQNKTGEFYKCPFGGPNGPCVYSGSWPSTT